MRINISEVIKVFECGAVGAGLETCPTDVFVI
jgi:hypothetical protein